VVVIVFDIDGVLIDSYRGVEVFYKRDLPRITGIDPHYSDYLLYLEMIGETIGWLREDWWFKYIPGLDEELYDKLITRYWERRIEYQTTTPGAKPVLSMLKKAGVKLYSVSYRDDIYGLKKYRIMLEGLDKYFKEIIVAGEDVSSRIDGLRLVMNREADDRVIYVDDKPLNLCEIMRGLSDKIILVHYSFKYDKYEFPWLNPGQLFTSINNLYELYKMINEELMHFHKLK